MSSKAQKYPHRFACSDMFQNIHFTNIQPTFISPTFISPIKNKKKIEVNELSELDYSKAPSTMSSYTQEHVFLHLHAQTIINTLLY